MKGIGILAIIIFSFVLNGCAALMGELYTDGIWRAEKEFERDINYTGKITKITIGNIRPTIKGKSKKHLDKKFDIKIQYEINDKQLEKFYYGKERQCVDSFSNNKCFIMTVRAKSFDEAGVRKLIKRTEKLPLDSMKLYVYNRNDEMDIQPRMCIKYEENIDKVSHILVTDMGRVNPSTGVYCMEFRKSIYEYELNLSQECVENEDDVVMLDYDIPLLIDEECTKYKNDVTATKILATPIAVGLDLMSIPVLLMLID